MFCLTQEKYHTEGHVQYSLFMAIKLLSIFMIISVISGCATQATQDRATKIFPFDNYSPTYKVAQGGGSSGKSDVKVALLSPGGEIKSLHPINLTRSDDDKVKNTLEKGMPFSESFKTSLRMSLESILLNKGYNVEGAFDSLDALTYGDKMRIDFLIIPEIKVVDRGKNECAVHKVPHPLTLFQGQGSCSGNMQLKGQFLFTVVEPLSREKLFMKSYEFDTASLSYGLEFQYYYYVSPMSPYYWPATLPIIAWKKSYDIWSSVLSKSTEDLYGKYIAAFEKYFPDNEERGILAKQARKLKKMKSF